MYKLFPVRLRFVWIGKTRSRDLLHLEDRYLRRLKRFFPVERSTVPELKKKDPRQRKSQMSREAELINSKMSPGTFLIVLDETGEQMTSRQLSRFLSDQVTRGISDLTFLVGGHLGIPEAVRTRANQTLSLSKMTLPHELARLVLLEQTYRAATILTGMPYHK